VYDRTVRPKKTIVKPTKSVREVYLQPDPTRSGSSSEWGSLDSYDLAKNLSEVRRSDEQKKLLDRAHWESNPNTQ
jgi:hypothetical protein